MLMNRICVILTLLLMAFTSILSAQNGEIEINDDFYKHFKGTIKKVKNNSVSEELTVYMNMRRKGSQITGSYYSTDDNIFYTIKGKMLNNKVFELTQYNNKIVKGSFRGVFKSESKASGSWKDPKAENTFGFTLEEDYSASVKFTSYTDTSYYHIGDDESKPYIRVSIDYLYPQQYTNKTALQILRMSLDKDFFGTYSATGDPSQSVVKKKISSFADYKNITERQFNNANNAKPVKKEMYQMYNRMVYFRTNVIFNNEGILTICKDSLEEAVSQSITEGISYFVYDLNNGKRISCDDLFYYPNYKDMMKDLFEKKIMKGFKYSSIDELVTNGYDADYIKYNRNFFVDRNGLGFYFNAYEINEEALQIYFPFEEIAQYLKEESPISHLYPPSMVFQKREEIKENEEESQAENEEEDEQFKDPDGYQDQFLIDVREGEVEFPTDETIEEGDVDYGDDE
jgi:hypothetical protein